MNDRILPELEWSVNGVKYAHQKKTHDVIDVRFAPPREYDTFQYELRLTLSALWNRVGRCGIMYSGGADSEMVARELMALGKRPELHFIRFDDGSNNADYEYAYEFTKQTGLPLYVHDHNIDAFLNSRQHIDLGIRYGTSDLSVITVYKYAEHMGLPLIMGPELMLQKHQMPGPANAPDDWYILVGEHTTSADRFMIRNRTPMIGELFYNNIQLLTSLLAAPEVRDLVNNKVPGRISFTNLKNPVLERLLGYPLVAKKKRHGYEPVYPKFRRAVNEVKLALPYQPFEYRYPVRELMKEQHEPV